MSLGGSGLNSANHAAHERLNAAFDIKTNYIPFKGTGQQLPALLSGEVALAFGSTTVVPLIQTRKVLLIAVSGAKRFHAFPEAPTIGESLPGYEVTSWNAMFAPAGTPREVIARLNGEIKRRSEVVGIFPNEDAVTRLIGALLLEQNDEWAVQRARYMTLETIATLSDDATVSLPAMAD